MPLSGKAARAAARVAARTSGTNGDAADTEAAVDAAEAKPEDTVESLSVQLKKLTSEHESLQKQHTSSLNTTKTEVNSIKKEIAKALEKSKATSAAEKSLTKLTESVNPLPSRIAALEAALTKKSTVVQTDLHGQMLNKLTARLAALEKKDVHPITKALLENKNDWETMGFKSEQSLVKFANDLPLAMKSILPKPEIAVNANAGKIVDIWPHLAKEEQKVVASVFPVVFGRPVEEWDKATPEEKGRSIADWAYIVAWRFSGGKE